MSLNNHSFMENPINYQYAPGEYQYLLKLQLSEILGAMDLPNMVNNVITTPGQIIYNVNMDDFDDYDYDGDDAIDEHEGEEVDNDDVFFQTQTESLNTYKHEYHPAPPGTMSKMSEYTGKLEAACALCLEQDEQIEGNIRTSCGHTFHMTCMQDWLIRGDFCPVCRFSFSS